MRNDNCFFIYLCETNNLQMKKNFILTALFACFVFVSCDGGDNKIEPINGVWYTFERVVSLSSVSNNADAKYLEERINVYYADDLNYYDIKKTYRDDVVITRTIKKTDPDSFVREDESTYSIEGDYITINDKLYGSQTYQFLLTNKVLTLHGEISRIEVEDIATQLGIVIPVPSDIKGTIKIKDYR